MHLIHVSPSSTIKQILSVTVLLCSPIVDTLYADHNHSLSQLTTIHFQLAPQPAGMESLDGITLTGALFSDAAVTLTLSIVLFYSGQCFALIFLSHPLSTDCFVLCCATASSPVKWCIKPDLCTIIYKILGVCRVQTKLRKKGSK